MATRSRVHRSGGSLAVVLGILGALVTLLAAGCATGPTAVQADDPVFGSWVNEDYNGTGDRPGRWVITPDGRELDYVNIADTEPYGEGRNTIEKRWTDAAGNRWYQVRSRGAEYPYEEAKAMQVFALQRISAGGTVFETVISFTDFPEEITPNPPEGQIYGIWYKQK